MTDNLQENLQERNQQVLNNITQLQNQEKEMYSRLSDVSLSAEEKQQIINKINELSQMRLNMYATLKDTYSYIQKNVSSSGNVLKQSIEAIDILETELNQAKARLNVLDAEKTNKLRLVEINTYYGKRYNAHSKIMKTIIIICIPIIILAFFRGIIPPNIFGFIVGLIIIIGMVLIGLQIIDISNRDNMNWDEYDWYFNKSDAPVYNGNYDDTNGNSDPWQTESATCIGSACCYSGSVYDSEKNMCIPKEDAEEFENLDKHGYDVVKATPVKYNTKPIVSKIKI